MAYSVIIAAAGKSTRFGENKLWYRLKDGKPVIVHTLEKFIND
jgi:CTP:molybdopterin cytidylyltransferase MocA